MRQVDVQTAETQSSVLQLMEAREEWVRAVGLADEHVLGADMSGPRSLSGRNRDLPAIGKGGLFHVGNVSCKSIMSIHDKRT